MLKDGRILNPRLLAALAGAGHTDLIVVADSGLPVPRGPELIDLSLVPGVPPFLKVLETVTGALAFEAALVALETQGREVYGPLRRLLLDVPVEEVPHEEFKRRVAEARTVIRTGECTPYANVGLIAGVTF
jgi:D-ribose pyranase